MIANRYRHEYSVTPGQLAKIAVQQRDNACANPDAIFYGEPITAEDVLSSPVIVDPLHRLEIVMPCAGAAALVITSAERAKRAPSKPAYLLGAGERLTHDLIFLVFATDAHDSTLMLGKHHWSNSFAIWSMSDVVIQ